jgi:flagellar biosynthesis component FlhA
MIAVHRMRSHGRIGLPAGHLLVNADPSELETTFGGTAAASVHPATGVDWALVAHQDRAQLDAAGLQTADALDHLRAAIGVELRRFAPALITAGTVVRLIRRSSSPGVDELVDGEVLQCVLAELLRDRLPLPHLAVLQEQIAMHVAAFGKRGVVEAVRAGVVAATTSPDHPTIMACLLHPDTERAMDSSGNEEDVRPNGRADQLNRALHAELGRRSSDDRPSVILTEDEPVRRRVREAIRVEHPELRVLRYRDLPDHVDVRPVTRLPRIV